MYSTKSFCNIFAFASNQPGVVSPIGELTTFAKTFTKELGVYHNPAIDGYDLLNFSSRTNDVAQLMPSAIANEAIVLVDEAVKITYSTVGEVFYDDLLLKLKQKAETFGGIKVEMGPMVPSTPDSSGASKWVPEWISWTSSTIPGSTDSTVSNTNKVWLTIDAFIAQYTDYEIVVVPPFDDLDSFFNPGSIVETRLKTLTPTQMMERVEVAKAGDPETIIRTDAYEYRDPVNSARRIDSYWTVLIYGPAGNDPDVIRDKLVTYILERSARTRDEWATIFPDIFKRTEFIVAPFWDTYAAEQRVFDHGIYSPILDHKRVMTWLSTYAHGYAAAHIDANAQCVAFPYRSLQMATIGHIENRDGKLRLTDYFPDFINTGTESTDFGRMSIPTQEWAVIMMDLVLLAERITTSTDLPKGVFRVIRGAYTYVGKTHNRVLYLVLAKSNIPSSVPQ